MGLVSVNCVSTQPGPLPELALYGQHSGLERDRKQGAKQVATRLGIPYLVVVHCVTASWAKKFAAHLSELPNIYRQAEAVIAVSQENLDLLHQLFGLPDTLGQVVYNGRPKTYFEPFDPSKRQRVRHALDIPDDAIVVFTSGRMEMVKGYQYQLKAIKQLLLKFFGVF